MAQNATIRPQQIERARKLLQDLPEKEDRKTRPEAAELLEKDSESEGERLQFQRTEPDAQERGYHHSRVSHKMIFCGKRECFHPPEKGDDTCRKTNLGKASFIVPDTSDEDL